MRINRFRLALLVVIGGLCLLYSLPRAARPQGGPPLERKSNPPTFIAHRGYSRQYPENTVGSILEAVAHGATWVEVDVRWTRDGEPVLHHDADLKASLGLDRKVGELTVRQIQARPIIGSAEVIPTLRQAMQAMSGDRGKLYLHLKDGEITADQARQLVAICRAHDFLGRVRFNSGSFTTLGRLREANSTVWLEYDLYDAKGLLWSNLMTRQDLRSIRALAVRSVGTFSFKIGDALVSEAHRHGLLIDALVSADGMPFHSERAAYREMLRLHVDEIMTDKINRYLR
ncbi:MAG TPA: glycerophosphodiester phosphodiesterase [Elusimicrobiota bacterium]|jgi:glycerophosphoryl diester phosphodiesterase|nr:glycerophosphodiester phosphodiesterase [Elusimicrobiota bacterium]